MRLAELIRANKGRIIERWKTIVVRRLSMPLDASELVDHLPELIDDLVEALESAPESWPALESAVQHGRQRVKLGVDLGGLTKEISLVGETIMQLAMEDEHPLPSHDSQLLMRIIGRAIAVSSTAYAEVRNQELAHQAAQHFSFIAHEIRNPLNNAQLATSLLHPLVSPAGATIMARLERALAQLTELVNNALVGARLSAEPEVALERVPVDELVAEARADIEANADARDIHLETDVGRFEVEVDRKLIVSALTNLLSNAIKFSPPGADIHVRARTEGDHSIIEVEDQCGGMPEDLPERLFQPFVQAGGDKSGFGLGLMIVKQAAEAHDGSVRVVNRPGVSCRFVLDLPRAGRSGAAPPATR